MRCGSTSTQSATPSFIVTASGCAPPMPPSPAVSVIVPGQRAAEAAAGDLGEALVGALHDALACRCRSTSRRSSARTSSGPSCLEPAELVPRRPVGHEVRVGDQHPRRPLVRAEDADRLARLHEQRLVVAERAQRRARSRRRPPRSARRGRCRRRRRGRRGARRPRGRGCSSASAARPPAASRGRRARCPRGARTSAARAHSSSGHRSLRSPPRPPPAARPPATSASAAASSGASQRSGPGPGTAARTAASAARGARRGLQRRAQVEPRAAAQVSSTARIAGQVGERRRGACAPPPQPIDTWSSCIALVGSESTLAGAARRRFSATIAACVYWAIIRPELTPGVLGEERRQAVRARRRRAGGRCGARRSRRPRPRRSRGSRRRSASGAPWKLPQDSTRPSGRTIGLSIADASSALGHALGVRERVAGRAVHLRRAAQRVGVLHPRVALAVAGDDRRAGEQAGAGSRRSRPGRAAGAARSGPRRRRDRCRAAPRRTSPRRCRRPAAEPAGRAQRQDQHAEHAVGAVDQREALLRRQGRAGSIPASRSASAARRGRAVALDHLALADQHERAVGERREVAARAERAVLGDDRA